MPARDQYQLHRYAARPSSMAPADAQSRAVAQNKTDAARSRAVLVGVPKGVLTDLRALAALWDKQAEQLEKSPGARFDTSIAARKARVEEKRRAANKLRELLNKI